MATSNSVKVAYPEDLKPMITAFKLCATARLFLQDLLPNVDAGIFLDNDIIALRDPAILWNRFRLFTPFTAIALAPVEAHYSRSRLPYFGLPGLGANAGVMLMNLTRLRNLPGGGFSEVVRHIWLKHGYALSLADQDLLNMVGSVSPWLIQPLPCTWNYHTWTCRPARFEMREIPRMREAGKNMCPEAESEGIGFLHGNSQAFTNGRDTLGKGVDGDAVFRAMFQFWVTQDLRNWDLKFGVEHLQRKIDEAIARDNMTDSCARVKGLTSILLKGLTRQAG